MSKVTYGANRKTPDQKRMEKEIIDQFGMTLSLSHIMKLLGKKSQKAARHWLANEEIDALVINGRKHWWATDVARALERSKMRAL